MITEAVMAAALSLAPAGDGDGGVWDDLAECESGGNWSEGGGGYDGGLQFSDSTWDAMGGEEYAPSADQATREQQIAIAERLYDEVGWSAWPSCSAQLGLSGDPGGDGQAGNSSGESDDEDEEGEQLPVTR